MTTVRLTARAAAGDESAFDDLFRRHYERVLRLTALRQGKLMEHCVGEIEDAVQAAFAETFLRLRDDAIAGIHSEHAFRRYIATAAANHVRSMKRKDMARVRGGDQRRVDHESLFEILGARGPGPATLHALHELEQKLEAALLELPQPYRQVLEMHCLAGMSYQDIADSGELATRRGELVDRTDMVRLLVHRARKKLDEAMGS